MLNNEEQKSLESIKAIPYMDEAKLCDRIALIQNGRFMKVDTPENIVAQFTEILWSVKSNQMHRLLKDLRNHPEIKTSFSFGESYHITLNEGLKQKELQEYLMSLGHKEVEINKIDPSVEDCFMFLSKKNNN